MSALGHLPVTCRVYVEEQEIFGEPGCNVRVRVLDDDGTQAWIRVEDCGVLARQGEEHIVHSAALNGGRL